MSKTKTTYTKKQIVKGLAPYAFIALMLVSGSSLITGWFMRSNFESTVKAEISQQVTEQVSRLKR
jgi:hypothetical protein